MAQINRRPAAVRRAAIVDAPDTFAPQQQQPQFNMNEEMPFGPDPSFGFDPMGGMGSPMGGPTSFSPGGGVPSGGPSTGIAKLAALSTPGALAPPVIPAGAAGVKTSTMASTRPSTGSYGSIFRPGGYFSGGPAGSFGVL